MSNQVFNTRTVLELACAAHFKNKKYVKESDVFFKDLNALDYKDRIFPNKTLILHTMLAYDWPREGGLPPKHLVVDNDARQLANDLEKFCRKLAFSVIADENSFESSIHTVMSKQEITKSEVGFIACLPQFYFRNTIQKTVEKACANCDLTYLGTPGQTLRDLDAEIIEVFKSKNYDAFNVLSIIDNKIASWMSNQEPSLGPAVVILAKIKDQGHHWKYHNPVTRLNYVKIAQ